MRERRRAHRFPGCAARRWITPSEPQGQSCPLPHPGGAPAPSPFGTGVGVFRFSDSVDSASIEHSGLHHAPCVRFAAGVPPHHATLGSGWGPALAGQVPHLPGRIEGFRHVSPSTCLPPLSRLCLAQQRVSIEMDSRIRGNDGLRTTVGECGLSSLAVNISYTPLRSENPVFCVVNAWKSGSP